jgi:hypothetical protein
MYPTLHNIHYTHSLNHIDKRKSVGLSLFSIKGFVYILNLSNKANRFKEPLSTTLTVPDSFLEYLTEIINFHKRIKSNFILSQVHLHHLK